MLCFLNGQLLPEGEARVSIADRGFLYGDSVFETTRVQAGRALFLSEHLERLTQGMQLLGFAVQPTQPEMRAACEQLIRANALPSGVLRVAVTRGVGTRGANPAGTHSPTLLATLTPLADLAQRTERGYRLVTTQWRKPPSSVLPNQAKTGNYLNSILAMQQAALLQADEAVLLDIDGNIAECSQSSLFFVHAGVLRTAALSSGVLHSITRSFVLRVAAELAVHVEEGNIAPASVAQAQEVFISNSVIGIMPVAQLDAARYVLPGRVTRLLQRRWDELLAQGIRNPSS